MGQMPGTRCDDIDGTPESPSHPGSARQNQHLVLTDLIERLNAGDLRH